MSTPIRILIADDMSLIRSALVHLPGSEPDMEIVGHARDGLNAIELALDLAPDVVLMDMTVPRMNGLDATRMLHSRCPVVRIVGLSMHAHDAIGEAMRHAGAQAYVSKDDAPKTLLAVIRVVTGRQAPQSATQPWPATRRAAAPSTSWSTAFGMRARTIRRRNSAPALP